MKKILALLLTLALCLSLLPAGALAEGEAGSEEIIEEATVADAVIEEADEPPVTEIESAAEPTPAEESSVEDEPAPETDGASIVDSGTCGDNLTWTLTSDGVLIISGAGEMKDYGYSSPVPWDSKRTSISEVVISEGVASIGDYAFRFCTGLTSVTISNSVTSIGCDAFYNCTRLTRVTIPDSVTSIGDNAFMDCTSLTAVTIPGSVVSISYRMFYGCTSLTSVTIGNGVTTIENWAFDDCTSLTTVTIPDSVTSIGSYAFRCCTSLTAVAIPGSVASIGGCAFSDCTSLTSVLIGNGVTSIGVSAFSDCMELTSVTIPDGVTGINDYAFWKCTSLTTVTIGRGVTSIGDHAFSDCTGLMSVTIPDGVTTIEDWAFDDCTSLTTVTIPDSVTSIGSYAFDGCTSLTDVYYGGTEEKWSTFRIGTPLRNATVHYNSTRDDAWHIITITPDEDSITYTVNGTGEDPIIVQFICKTPQMITLSDIQWSFDDTLISLSDADIIGPTITGEDDTYWISAVVTGLRAGEGTIRLTIFGYSASVRLIVEDALAKNTFYGIGTLTAVDDNLNFIVIDDEISYQAEQSVIEAMRSLLNDGKITDKRVVFSYDGYNVVKNICSIYDVLTVGVKWDENAVLSYDTDAYVPDQLTITYSLCAALKPTTVTEPAFSDAELRYLMTAGEDNPLYIDVASVTAKSVDIAYFGKTAWFKNKSKAIEQSDSRLYYIPGAAAQPAIAGEPLLADLDGSAKPASGSEEHTLFMFSAALAGSKNDISLGTYQATVEDHTLLEQESALSALYKSLEGSNIQFTLVGGDLSNSFSDAQLAAMEYVVKVYTLEAIASYNQAESWTEELANNLKNEIQNKILGKLGLSGNVIPETGNITLNLRYSGPNKNGSKSTVDFEINISAYLFRGGNPYGSLVSVSASVDGRTGQYVGVLTYVNWNSFADSMLNFIKIAYNESWGKSADKLATEIIGEPLTQMFDLFKKSNQALSFCGISFKFPTSVSGALFSMTDAVKSGYAKCPVDVYIYDTAGKLCGAIIDDKVCEDYTPSENLQLWVEGSKKCFTLYDADYSVMFVGTDDGVMEYGIDEYDNGVLIRSVRTENIPLDKGIIYMTEIPKMLNVDAEVYELVSVDGNIVIPVTTDTAPSESQDFILGDVNGDGEITSFDASLILRYEVGLIDDSTINLAAADVNGDNEITSFDASLILRYEVGLISSFPTQ